MKLVQNTTDISDDVIVDMLKELEGDNELPVAVKVRNSWVRPDFRGIFYPNFEGAKKHGCKHLITLHVPPKTTTIGFYGKTKQVLKVTTREEGLRLIATHETTHARLEEGSIPQTEVVCDLAMMFEAELLGVEVVEEAENENKNPQESS